MTPTKAQQDLANESVRIMYGSFPLDSLEEILSIGNIHERDNPRVEVIAMNVALRAEIERRKAEVGR